ncbi:MAG: GGDEF domain-containing protein [Magnetococcales bacterium]|nr:GGDEF domain-containing protein [Magnetococcales bacterium]
MGIIVNLESRSTIDRTPILISSTPSNLVLELDHYRRKNEELARIYELHRKLGEQLDLASMIDTFSSWLVAFFEHDLLAYRHQPRNRMHMTCSDHGPHRQRLVDCAQKLLEASPAPPAEGFMEEVGLFYHFPLLASDVDRILLLHQKPFLSSDPFYKWEEDVFMELRGPLERALAYEDLYDLARRDALTGLVNRRVFEERLGQEMTNAERYGHPLVLAGLDLDHFKSVNDLMGHAEGDQALVLVSKTLSSMIRDSDLLARIGGDEFALILPNTDIKSAEMLMNRLCDGVASLKIQAPGAKPLGVSIGVSAWQAGFTKCSWVEQVDQALYRAKASGRSRVSF